MLLKNIRSIMICTIAILGISACQKVSFEEDPLLGAWIFDSFDTELNSYNYIHADKLDEDLPGYIFFINGKLLSRQNSGWCGTPPISYANYNGSWYYLSDSTVHLSTAHWASPEGAENQEYIMEIIDISEDYLSVFINK